MTRFSQSTLRIKKIVEKTVEHPDSYDKLALKFDSSNPEQPFSFSNPDLNQNLSLHVIKKTYDLNSTARWHLMVITESGLFAKIFVFESQIPRLCHKDHNLGDVFSQIKKTLSDTPKKSCKDLGFEIVQNIEISDPEVSEYKDIFRETIQHNVTIGDVSHAVQISYNGHLHSDEESGNQFNHSITINDIATFNIRIFNLQQTDTGLTYILVVSTDNGYTASKKVTFINKEHQSEQISENVYVPKSVEDEQKIQINLTDGKNLTVDLSSDIDWNENHTDVNTGLVYRLQKLNSLQKCEIQVWQKEYPKNEISINFTCPEGMYGTDDSQSSKIWIIAGAIGVPVVLIGICICIVLACRKPPEDPNAEPAEVRQARIDAEAKIAEDMRRYAEEVRQQELARGEQNIYVQ